MVRLMNEANIPHFYNEFADKELGLTKSPLILPLFWLYRGVRKIPSYLASFHGRELRTSH